MNKVRITAIRQKVYRDLIAQYENLIKNYLQPTWNRGLIKFAYPNVPNKPEQAYRLTTKGLELYSELLVVNNPNH